MNINRIEFEVLQIVNNNPGIKYNALITDLIKDGNSINTDELFNLIQKLNIQKKIEVVVYTLIESPYRERLIIFPAGTQFKYNL